jgi:hypothetical protein
LGATTRLRHLLKSGRSLFVPGCYNALTARILEQVGFPALYMTGYGTSLSLLGMPDAGLATMTETSTRGTSPAPSADADNGYGNAINVMRAVCEYIGTSCAAQKSQQRHPAEAGVVDRAQTAGEQGRAGPGDRIRESPDPRGRRGTGPEAGRRGLESLVRRRAGTDDGVRRGAESPGYASGTEARGSVGAGWSGPARDGGARHCSRRGMRAAADGAAARSGPGRGRGTLFRMEPMTRSTKGFYPGARGARSTARIPIRSIGRANSAP